MRIAILMTNTDESDFAHRHPKDGEKFAALMALARPEWEYPVFSVKDGLFPNGEELDGAIITGSPASVHDGEPWIGQLEDLVRDLLDEGTPVFGACFGHQLIAKALGGRVGDNPQGWVKGVVEARYDTANMQGFASHTEQVLEAPAEAEVVAYSEGCPVAGFRLSKLIETTQYHPEMTPGFFTALLDEYGPKLPADVVAKARASLGILPNQAAWADRIVRFFENAKN